MILRSLLISSLMLLLSCNVLLNSGGKPSAAEEESEVKEAAKGEGIDGASVGLPPGTILTEEVKLEKSEDLVGADSDLSALLNENEVEIEAMAAAVSVSAGEQTTAPGGLSITIPAPEAATSLTQSERYERLAVAFRSFQANGDKLVGLIPYADLEFKADDNTVTFAATHFGVFQAVILKKVLSKKLEVTSTPDKAPPTPGSFTATADITNSSFKLQWNAATDNKSKADHLLYFVCSGSSAAALNSVDKCLSSEEEMAFSKNVLSLEVGGKVAAHTYYYNVVVRDEAGNQALYPGISVQTIDDVPPVAGAITAANIAGTSFTINWVAATDNSGASATLEYFVCSGSASADIDTLAECAAATSVMAFNPGTLSVAISGKTPVATYHYNVIVRDPSGNQTLYPGITVTTIDDVPPTPNVFAASTSISGTGFTLNWASATDNISTNLEYFVCYGTSAAEVDTVSECLLATEVMGFTVNTVTHVVSGKAPDSTYYYNVVVRDEAGNQSIYNGLTQATPDQFISTWDTTQAGTSGSNQITLPLQSSGTYNFTVYWGDGNSDFITTWNDAAVTHTYGASGSYEVAIEGTIQGFQFNNGGDKLKIIDIGKWGPLNLGNSGGYFYGAANLSISATDALDLTGTLVMNNAFRNCTTLSTAPSMALWDTSAITNMSWMFGDATNFNADISSWDVGSVTNVGYMFRNASSFNQNISGWDTAGFTTPNAMFNGASSFNQPIGSWDMSSATNMSQMFSGAAAFNQNLSTWNVTSVTNMSNMFYGATVFNGDITSWVVSSVTNMSSMFYFTNAFNQDISGWDVSSVTTMSNMFNNADAFNQDISGWTVSSVNNMQQMFYGTDSFNQPIGTWNVTSVTTMLGMFDNSSAFDQDISLWSIGSVADMSNMFRAAMLSTANYDALLIGWEAQAPQAGINFNGGASQYSAGAAATARASLIGTYSWSITDAGQAP